MNRAIAVVTMAMLVGGAPAPVAGQAAGKADALPTGWSARPDGDKDLTNVKFVAMGQGYHVTLGPATVFYRKTDDGKGPFHLVAKFTQTKAPGHPEGYGLFYGGNDLAGAGQRYTYFLVRGDGQFLIKRRNGKETSVVAPWTANSAIKPADAKGQATNLLEIDTKRDPTKVIFLVNGQEVHSIPATPDDISGITGLRVNHNLDVHIEGFAVHR